MSAVLLFMTVGVVAYTQPGTIAPAGAGSLTQFVLLTNPYLKFAPLSVELSGVDLFTCARLCIAKNNSCFSFIFIELLETCSLGSWLTSSPVAISHVNTYTQPCNTAANFTLQQSGDVRVCVRMSADLLNFTDARDMCKSFGGTLYTPKTPEKLTILKNVCVHYSTYIWVGLHDMVTEDVFQWVDDGSIVSDSWREVIFAPGQPNSVGNQDCVSYSPVYSPLHDTSCTNTELYLCQMGYLS